jgi:hypothetical protein
MGMAAPILSIAGPLAGAAGSIMGGADQGIQDQWRASELDTAAKWGAIQGIETNASMTQNLAQTLAHLDAVTAAQRVGPGSPSAAAIRNQTEFLGTEEMHRKVEAINAQSMTDEASAQYLKWAAGQSMLGGDLGALGPLAKAFGGIPALQGPSASEYAAPAGAGSMMSPGFTWPFPDLLR